jgi:aminoglycoside 6'-N-acetyltransferase I
MIRKAEYGDLKELAELGVLLWPHHTAAELAEEFSRTMAKEDAAFFLAFADGAAVGFAQCQLRHDYVEGTDSSPVGYLEGIFVKEGKRQQGIAKMLLSACEAWAGELGCREFASDCELDNAKSLRFHLGLGFEEANRIICFRKRL